MEFVSSTSKTQPPSYVYPCPVRGFCSHLFHSVMGKTYWVNGIERSVYSLGFPKALFKMLITTSLLDYFATQIHLKVPMKQCYEFWTLFV